MDSGVPLMERTPVGWIGLGINTLIVGLFVVAGLGFYAWGLYFFFGYGGPTYLFIRHLVAGTLVLAVPLALYGVGKLTGAGLE